METFDNFMPFNVGDVLRLKPGGRIANWRPNSNKESHSRLARVTKISKKEKWLFKEQKIGWVTGVYVKPEHRVKNVWIHPDEFKLFEKFDPLRVNVYADWLEENGEVRAAEKLRTAFPLGDVR